MIAISFSSPRATPSRMFPVQYRNGQWRQFMGVDWVMTERPPTPANLPQIPVPARSTGLSTMLVNQQTLQDLQRWAIDEIDETTRRELMGGGRP